MYTRRNSCTHQPTHRACPAPLPLPWAFQLAVQGAHQPDQQRLGGCQGVVRASAEGEAARPGHVHSEKGVLAGVWVVVYEGERALQHVRRVGSFQAARPGHRHLQEEILQVRNWW